MRIGTIRLAPVQLWLVVLSVTCLFVPTSALSIISSIHGVTPWKTATARSFGAGDDTISSVHRLFSHGRTLAIAVRHHGRLHENKKNGGPTYTRWIDVKLDVPNGIDPHHLFVSSMLVNMANPKDNALTAMLEAMDHGITAGVPLGGKDLVDYFTLPFARQLRAIPGVDLPGLWSRFSGRFKNADGVVWYSNVDIGNLEVPPIGHVWDGSCTRNGLAHNAVYEVDWKIVKQ